ncbi:hypothetical protein B0H14DRAFT_3710540 [Mycena olivaceomarginata]|nr:hypothetical protein B0H14DRAFT_3710540 [Mycena olivaceomarginata]
MEADGSFRADVIEMEADESGHSDPDPPVVPDRKTGGNASKVGTAFRTPTKTVDKPKGEVASLSGGPKVPLAEFGRLREASPAKKAKLHETVLHTVNIKSICELPAKCEVMNPELRDPMMQSIYELKLPNLKWARPGDNLEFKRGPRWVLSIDAKPAVCVSIVNSVQSSLHQISSVYGATNGATPLLKFMTGVHLSQDFDRIAGLCGMLNMSALTFSTKGIPIDKFEKLNSPDNKGIKSTSSVYRKQTYTAPTDTLNYDDEVPVYDGRHTGFDASVDIDNLAHILPRYDQEIPSNSCTAVAYTVTNYVKSSVGRVDEEHLSFNIKWIVVLGEPE